MVDREEVDLIADLRQHSSIPGGVVVTDSDQKVLTVENPEALKGHEGHHVAVTGTMGKDSIKVSSAKML